MDLSTLYDHEQLFPLEITDPLKGEPVGLTIQLRSDKSRAYKAIELRQAEERANEQRRGAPMSGEREKGRVLDLACSLVADWSWTGDATFHGERPECTPENVRKVFDELDWIFEQVWREKANIENFTGRSETNYVRPFAITSDTA